jgi:hypothetical protein
MFILSCAFQLQALCGCRIGRLYFAVDVAANWQIALLQSMFKRVIDCSPVEPVRCLFVC